MAFLISNGGNKVFHLLLTVIGIALLAIAGNVISGRLSFLSTAHAAPGVVKSLSDGGSHPQIEFTNSTGQAISFPQGGLIYGYQVGEPVEVLYRSENPSGTAIISDKGALWGTPALLGMIGLTFATVGLSRAARGRVSR